MTLPILHISHTDLDGYGCQLMTKWAYPDREIEFMNFDYEEIDGRVKGLIVSGDHKKYETILITDISVKEEVAELIEKSGANVALIDHHKTALWLNKYPWALVEVTQKIDDGNGIRDAKACGTTLLARQLWNVYGIELPAPVLRFAEAVRKYDTWEWKDVYKDEFPKTLNDLFSALGKRKFMERFGKDMSLELKDRELYAIELEADRMLAYAKGKSKNIKVRKINGLLCGIIYSEQYSSFMGNYLAEKRQDLDVIVMINMSYGISYRTVKEDIDLGEFAKNFGGGGHPKAAGSPMKDKVRDIVSDILFL